MRRDLPSCRLAPVQAMEPRVRAALEGQHAAADSLLAELLPRVRNRVRHTLHTDAEVDDVTQEALMAILRGLPTYRGEGAFVSWADRVVVRVTFAAMRRAHAERYPFELDDEDAERALSWSEEPSGDSLLRYQLEKFLGRLSDEQRRALLLHHVMGMSVPEMAEALEVPFETVRSRLRLGMAHLRELLSREAGREVWMS